MFKLAQHKILFSFTVLLNIGTNCLADNCPPSPSSVDPTFSVSTSYDKKTQLYRYKYEMKNGKNARIPLDYFGLLINKAPTTFNSPTNWTGKFISLSFSPYTFRWSTSVVDPAIADVVTGDGTLSPPISAIQVGKALSGFEIASPQPPGVVQYFAQGFTQIASGVPTAGNDEPTPTCPSWDFENPQIQTQVTGATTGPSDTGVVSVILRAREETGLHASSPIKVKAPTGKIAVLILSTSDFDASKVDPSSVIFGPGYATPTSSKLVPTGAGEDIGKDERFQWEKELALYQPEKMERKNVHPKNLLLTFDISSLDAQCTLDQSLFLRGKTTTGIQIIGAISANLIGCKDGEYGTHKHHSFPSKWWLQQKK